MRVLPDEQLPRQLAAALTGHEIRITVSAETQAVTADTPTVGSLATAGPGDAGTLRAVGPRPRASSPGRVPTLLAHQNV